MNGLTTISYPYLLNLTNYMVQLHEFVPYIQNSASLWSNYNTVQNSGPEFYISQNSGCPSPQNEDHF